VPATGIVLAAGSGSRFGRPKADLVVDGQRLLDRAVAVLRAGGCDEVVAVVRPGTAVAGATVVENPDPARGMGSSLRLGLAAARGERAVVLLVDTPGVGAAAVRRLLAADAPVAIATYGGRRGHPVAFAASTWDEVGRLAAGDQGARAFLRARPDLVTEVPCEGEPADIDTPADLAAWEAAHSAG
jgi:CTP:molybdopterin cytidylyltransferase MocA